MNEESEEPMAPIPPMASREETPEAVEESAAPESAALEEEAPEAGPLEETEETEEPDETEEVEGAEVEEASEAEVEEIGEDETEETPQAESEEPVGSGEPVESAEAVEDSGAIAEGETSAPAAPKRRRERRPTERAEMESAIEAILFVSSEPVPRARLVELFDEEDRPEAEGAIDAVLERFGPTVGRGFMAEEVAGGVRLATRPELVGWLRRFFDVSSGTKLSMAALETLAIVAYRQPITGPEIQELRSVSAAGTLKTLLERRLVRIAGRKEVVGKPFLYGTTREFLVHFGLKSLADLPPLEEFEETFGSDPSLVDRSLGGPETESAPAEAPESSESGVAAEAGGGETTEAAIATLSAADESRERELIAAHEEIEEREEASASTEAGSQR